MRIMDTMGSRYTCLHSLEQVEKSHDSIPGILSADYFDLVYKVSSVRIFLSEVSGVPDLTPTLSSALVSMFP